MPLPDPFDAWIDEFFSNVGGVSGLATAVIMAVVTGYAISKFR